MLNIFQLIIINSSNIYARVKLEKRNTKYSLKSKVKLTNKTIMHAVVQNMTDHTYLWQPESACKVTNKIPHGDW